MIQLLETREQRKRGKKEWSNEFLLPLTGLKRTDKYDINTYLFWKENKITDYKLVLTLDGGENSEMVEYSRKEIFPILDKKGYLLESYDVGEMIVFILDMSEWAWDIDKFVEGKYSKLSEEAKSIIEVYHTFNKNKISLQLVSILYPNRPQALLDKRTPLEYVAENYGFDINEMQKIGELGSLYNELDETLITDIRDLIR